MQKIEILIEQEATDNILESSCSEKFISYFYPKFLQNTYRELRFFSRMAVFKL